MSKKSKTEELTKRGAAAMAHATAGRNRVINSKKVYKRSLGQQIPKDNAYLYLS